MLLVREPDTLGQMRRFSYNAFIEPKPRFLNYMMVYPVRTVADTSLEGLLKSYIYTVLQNKIHVHLLAPAASASCCHKGTWERLLTPLDTLKAGCSSSHAHSLRLHFDVFCTEMFTWATANYY